MIFLQKYIQKEGKNMSQKKSESGYLMIEAAFIFPIYMLIVLFLFYILLLTAQRAQVVSAAEQTMVYVKYVCSGNYSLGAEFSDNKELYDPENGMKIPTPGVNDTGEIYNVYSTLFDTPASRARELNDNNGAGIKKIFDYYLKTPLLGTIDGDFELKADVHNYVLFTQLDIDVSYKMKQFINFSYIGGEYFNHPTFTVHTEGVISDNTSTIRNLQYVDFLLYRFNLDSRGNNIVKGVKDTVGEYINKIKEWFGVSDNNGGET